MQEQNHETVLTGSGVFYPEDATGAYRIDSGNVFVYIIRWEKTGPGRRILLCEAAQGAVIPGFVYRDSEYRNWRFAITVKGEKATVRKLEYSATTVLHQKFLAAARIHTYQQEGFENSLTEYYQEELLKDKVFIDQGVQAGKKTDHAITDVVKEVFKEEPLSDLADNETYRAVSFLCGKMGIPLISEQAIILHCGSDPSVSDIARVSNFICREIVLEADWYQNDCGSFVSHIGKDLVACIPLKRGKYYVFYAKDNKVEPLTRKIASQISPQAHALGRTLPNKKLTWRDLLAFGRKSLSLGDVVPIAVLALVTALIGVLLPTLNQMIYDDYIPLGEMSSLVQICSVMLSFMIGNLTFQIVKNLFDFRAASKVGNDLQNAAYHRIFHLPESFFRDYDSADLANRIGSVGAVASSYANVLVITSFSALFSIVYLIRMWSYSGKLSVIGLGMYLLYLAVAAWMTAAARKGEAKIAEADAQASSRLYQYLNGVDKIRMAGVEERAVLTYMRPYARQQQEEIKVGRILSAKEAIGGVITSVFSMVLYLVIVKSKVELSVGAFVAFNTAFGSFCGAIESLVEELLQLYQEKETVNRFWPVFEAAPEDDEKKEIPGELAGSLKLENVRFAYETGGRNIIDGMSLEIKDGEYLGIVGTSGCGKSTLLKLLLGFETPQQGTVRVGGKDLRDINKGAYRKQLGVVLQNGKLISGSIYENITITAPHVSMKRVNEVIDQVGLREDISQMPMGIHTVLSENANTISGGQQQRILIARAIVGSPKILIFDEATSALDNNTQAVVSSNLDKMNVTRIVVAHRLSTIKNCSRILVLKDGHIAEEGNYESLMAKRGLFFQLANRQIAQRGEELC